MKHQLQINEDWERESLKDFVYLCEQQILLEQEFQRVIREPAEIIVIDKDNVLDKLHEYKHNTLPF
jgi:hypothetical protein